MPAQETTPEVCPELTPKMREQFPAVAQMLAMLKARIDVLEEQRDAPMAPNRLATREYVCVFLCYYR